MSSSSALATPARTLAAKQPEAGAHRKRTRDKSRTARRDTSARLVGEKCVAPDSVHRALGSAGEPIDADTRGFMELRLGHDFSHVRIHADSSAACSARAVDAQAYTVGRHVFFGQGRYSPRDIHGRRLLAHELAHVVQQQNSNAAASIRIGRANDSEEHQADLAAHHALTGDRNYPITVAAGNPVPVLRRQKEEVGAKPDIAWIAEEVYQGMKGLGTDEERVYRALERLRRNSVWLAELRGAYRKYGDLDEDLEDDFSGTELEYALQLINKGDAHAPQAPRVDLYSWEELRFAAHKLREELTRFETDEEAVYALLLPLDHNPHLILGLEMAFEEQTRGQERLRARLEEEMSGEELAHALYLISIPYEWWVRRANEKLRETQFGIPWGSFCGPEPKRGSTWPDAYDDRYWTQQHDPGLGCKLVLKEGVLPSTAIEALVEEQDRWNIDCGVFVQLVHWYAMLHVDGPRRFDERLPRPVELREEKSTGLDVEATFCRQDFDVPLRPCELRGTYHVPIQKSEPVDQAGILRSAPVGTRVVFSNPLVAAALQRLRELPGDVIAYQHENSVKLGNDEYGAFPLREGERFALSRSEIVDRMSDRTYSALGKTKDEVKAQIFISLIQITRPKQ